MGRLLIAAGGTGGHIYPGLTIATEWQHRYPAGEVLFVGTRHGLEGRLVPQGGFPLQFVQAAPLSRKPSLATLGGLARTSWGLAQALRLISSFRPTVVVGTGGYAAGPVLAAAILARKPTLIQEQNAYPGLTNRLLARWVDVIALGYEEAGHFLSSRARQVITGNPIRKEIVSQSRAGGLKNLQISEEKRVLVVFGASQGARQINQAMIDNYRQLVKKENLQVIHQTGPREYDRVLEALGSLGTLEPRGDGHAFGNLWILPYIHNMPDVLAVAHLVVARAGAISIAELTARGLPAILVPYPYAAENHQERNARVLEQAGAARVILDRELTGPALWVALEELLSHDSVLERMAAASKKLGRPEAVERIVDLIEELAGLASD
ncbi:MAG: undecaprenyldiphospho-muramoylpentapeptide beta-N-acetylglucosaminyltransferase [Limnochordia bacterium]|jgi:UDP-N-acetylglucosamine--N-acetylmuramyl-(pentapeptide) pyrophosphoryl-undecaprenol N-acetylglucosamine transferase